MKITIDFDDGVQRVYTVEDPGMLLKMGHLCRVDFCHPDHAEMMDVTFGDKLPTKEVFEAYRESMMTEPCPILQDLPMVAVEGGSVRHEVGEIEAAKFDDVVKQTIIERIDDLVFLATRNGKLWDKIYVGRGEWVAMMAAAESAAHLRYADPSSGEPPKWDGLPVVVVDLDEYLGLEPPAG